MSDDSTVDTTPESIQALRKIIALARTQENLADILGKLTGETVKQSRISMWIFRGRVAHEWVIPLERAAESLGGKITRHDIRSDLYPRDRAA